MRQWDVRVDMHCKRFWSNFWLSLQASSKEYCYQRCQTWGSRNCRGGKPTSACSGSNRGRRDIDRRPINGRNAKLSARHLLGWPSQIVTRRRSHITSLSSYDIIIGTKNDRIPHASRYGILRRSSSIEYVSTAVDFSVAQLSKDLGQLFS